MNRILEIEEDPLMIPAWLLTMAKHLGYIWLHLLGVWALILYRLLLLESFSNINMDQDYHCLRLPTLSMTFSPLRGVSILILTQREVLVLKALTTASTAVLSLEKCEAKELRSTGRRRKRERVRNLWDTNAGKTWLRKDSDFKVDSSNLISWLS
jgi:hypothetical protein